MSDPAIWMLNLLAWLSLASGLAWLALRFTPKHRLALRHAILLAALVLVLAAPFGAELGRQSLGSSWGLTRQAQSGDPQAKSVAHEPQGLRPAPNPQGFDASGAAPLEAPSPAALGQQGASPFGLLSTANGGLMSAVPWVQILLGSWAVGSLVLLLRNLGQRRRLRALRQDLDPADAQQALLWQSVGASLGLRRPARLHSSSKIQSPLAMGFWRPLVVLPAEGPKLEPAQWRAIFLHEAAHLKHGHLRLAELQILAGILFWWHPGVAWLRREMEKLQEMICDAQVLVAGADRHEFVEALLQFAERATAPGMPALGILHRSQLAGRVRSLLDAGSNSPRLDLSRSAALAVGLLALVAGCGMTKGSLQPETKAPEKQQSEDRQGIMTVLTTEAFGARPKPVRPDDLEILPPVHVQVAEGMPPVIQYGLSRASTAWIDGQAVDAGIAWEGIKVYQTLMSDLIAVDQASGELLWKARGSAFYRTMGIYDMQPGIRKRWMVRLGQGIPVDRKLDAFFDLKTGERVKTEEQKQLPAGKQIKLGVWSGSKARNDERLVQLAENQAQWRALRRSMFAGIELSSDLDPAQLDFSTHALLVVSSGLASNCRGIGLESAYDQGNKLLLRLAFFTYQTASFGDADEEEIEDSERERPYGIYLIPRAAMQREVVLERNRQGIINGPPIWKEMQRLDMAKL